MKPFKIIIAASVGVTVLLASASSTADANTKKTATKQKPMVKSATLEPSPFVQNVIDPQRNYSKAFLDGAVAKSSAILISSPDDVPALVTRGFAKWKLEQYHAALRDLEMAINLDPKLKDFYVFYVAGECYREVDETKKAFDAYSKAIELAPAFVVCHLRKAQMLIDQKQFKKALPEADYLVKVSKDKTWVYVFRGKLRRMDGQYQGAVEDFTTAISSQPNDASLYLERATAYDRLGQKVLAAKDRKTNELLTRDNFPP